MVNYKRWLVAASVLFCVGDGGRALAQTIAVPVAPSAPAESDRTIFQASYFVSYNPVTAADMVARIPGFELRDGDDRRGFGGTAGNLLVNGERPSSKVTSSDLLRRIPAKDVARIEVVAGTNAQSDIRGQSQFVNVVTLKTQKSASTSYSVGVRHVQFSNRLGLTAQVSSAIPLGPKAELSLDIQTPTIVGRSINRDVLRSSGGATTGSRLFVARPNNIALQGAARLRWQADAQNSVNLNAQYVPNWNETNSFQVETLPNGALSSSILGRTEYHDNYSFEVGGDWDHRISSTLSTKLIVLISDANVDQWDQFNILNAPASRLIRVQDRLTTNGERIVRGRLKWTASSAHTLEFGAEGAFNFRDTALKITNQLPGLAPTPVALPVADARIEETRGEVFASDIWTVSPSLTLETDLNVEASRITQSGDQQQQRDFKYIKPRLIATYRLSPQASLNASLIRDVSQLDFAEFSSAVDYVNTSTILGNPSLRPEKAWKFRLEWESHLTAHTALTAAAFYDRIEDVHDLVVLNHADAFGNIGNGTRIGAEVRATVPLSGLGIANAELRLNGLYQQTRVTDPLTGKERSFSIPIERQGSVAGAPVLNAGNKDWAYVVNFRQNLDGLQGSWGVIVTQWAGRKEFHMAEDYSYVRKEPRIDLFLETTAWKPVTVRFFLNNILTSTETRTRNFYVGTRASGTLSRSEVRQSDGAAEASRILGFQVSGHF
jgi:outer membrane receptor for ferrienterochelin and colicin